MTAVLPAGFASAELVGATVVMCRGPWDDAAGALPDEDRPDLSWTRQVLTTGRLTVAALALGTFDRTPEGFGQVHELVERIARDLGIGAAEVAVLAVGRSAKVHHGWAAGDGYTVSADVTNTPAALLTTDAKLAPGVLGDVLAALPDAGTTPRVMVASGATGATPTTEDLVRVSVDALRGAAA